ncbi:hypothetical protein P9112_010819 [Eukaryota sp. TZLM1-RC]
MSSIAHHDAKAHSHHNWVSKRLQSLHPINNSFGFILLIISLLQLIAFVLRRIDFHPIFDVKPLVDVISLALYDTHPSTFRTVFMLSGCAFLIILSVLLFRCSPESHQWVSSTLSFVLLLISTIFLIPGISMFASFIPCGRTISVADPTFIEGLVQCTGPATVLLRIVSTIGLVLMILISFLAVVCVNGFDDITSNHFAGRSHNSCHLLFWISQVALLLVFFSLHTRIWLFRVFYFGCAVVTFISFTKRLPYYNRYANLFFNVVQGMWVGTSLAFLVRPLLGTILPHNVLTDSIIYYSLMLLGVLGGYYLTHRRYIKLEEILLSLHAHYDEQGLLEEKENVVADDNLLRGQELKLHFPKPNVFSVDVLSRCLDPKPHKSEFKSTIKLLYDSALHLFPESIEMMCMKANIEIHLFNDLVAASAILSSIKTLDKDIHFHQNCWVGKLTQTLEVRRRKNSIGQTMDTSSFLSIQRQQKQLSVYHDQCLEELHLFWKQLLVEEPDLNKLLAILKKVQKKKEMFYNQVNKLLKTNIDQQPILKSYAKFIREIECDEELAMEWEQQAQLMASSENGSSHEGSSFSGSLNVSRSAKLKRRSKSLNIDQVERAGAGSKKKQSAIKVLHRSVLLALVILLALSARSFSTSSNILSLVSHRLNQLYEVDGITHLASYLDLTANMMFLHQGLEANVTQYANQLDRESRHLDFHVRRLSLPHPVTNDGYDLCERSIDFDVQPPSPQVQALLQDPRYAVVYDRDFIPPKAGVGTFSPFELGLRHTLESSLLAHAVFNGQNVTLGGLSRVQSSLEAISNAMISLASYFLDSSTEFFRSAQFEQILSILTALMIIIFIALGLFRRSFAKITRQRSGILNLFLYVPKAEVERILNDEKFISKQKSKATHNEEDSISDDVESLSESSDNSVLRSIELDMSDHSRPVVEQKESMDIEHSPSQCRSVFVIVGLVVLLSLVIFMYSFFHTTKDVEFINSRVVILQSVRNAVSEILNLDKESSSSALMYTAFGDEFFLNQYMDVVQSGRRQDLLHYLLSLDLTPSVLQQISESCSLYNELRYVEDIALTIATFAHQADSAFLNRFEQFNYNFIAETNYLQKRLKYPQVTLYSTKNEDMEKSKVAQLELVYETLTNDRWTDLAVGLHDEIENVAAGLANAGRMEVLATINSIKQRILPSWGLLGVSMVLVLLLLVISLAQRPTSRRYKRCVPLLFIMAIILLGTLHFILLSSSYRNSQVNSVFDAAERSFDLLKMVVDAEFQFQEAWRRFQVSIFESDCNVWTSGQEHYNSLLLTIAAITNIDSQGFVAPRIIDDAKQLQAQLSSFEFYVNITGQISLNWCNQSNLHQFYYDFSEGQAPLLYNNFTLTNSFADSSLSEELRQSLGMAVISSRKIHKITESISSSLTRMRDIILEGTIQVSDDDVKQIYSLARFVRLLIILCLASMLLGVTLFVIGGNTRTKSWDEHVNQKMDFSEVQRFTLHYALSLAAIFVIIAGFYIVSLVGFTQLGNYPLLLHQTALRVDLITDIAGQITYGMNNFIAQKAFFRRAKEVSIELIDLHQRILNSGVLNDPQQSLIHFSNEHNNNGNIALHALLNHFVYLTRRFCEGENEVTISPYSEDLHKILSLGEQARELALDSADAAHTYSIGQIFRIRVTLTVLIIVFVTALLFTYLLVYRNMLKLLAAEEATMVEFLDMMSDDILQSVDLIRDYISEHEL